MRFTLILSYIACFLMAIGFGFFGIVQIRHAKRHGGACRSLLIKLSHADIKLIKIGAIIAGIGFILLLIMYKVTGGEIKSA